VTPEAQALLVFVPVAGALCAHAPVLRFDLLCALARPIDAGARFRGRRVLGDNKTWRGAFVMFGGAWAATSLLSCWPAWWLRLPLALQQAGPVVTGALIGLGTVLAEVPGSFLKRQLDIAPGARQRSPAGVLLSVWDQADFVPGVALALMPLWRMPLRSAVIGFAVVGLAHLTLSAAGYALGARRTIL
jgi:hypothetical protein